VFYAPSPTCLGRCTRTSRTGYHDRGATADSCGSCGEASIVVLVGCVMPFLLAFVLRV
jgi:hypothetical protein